ncbi:MAG: flippase [Hyphomicrobiaceae bacterium]
MSSIFSARVAKNFLALAVLQGGNYLLPLVLIPFLARTLGLETFGDWVFAVSFVSIFRTLVAYGFDLTATRTVSVHRDNGMLVLQLYAVVITVRFAMLALSYVIFAALALTFSNIWNVATLTLLSMLVLVGEALFPIWLFQGKERMATITQLRLGYRTLFVIAVLLTVRSADDVYFIPLIEAAGSLATGLLAGWIAFGYGPLKWQRPDISFFKEHVASGGMVCLSSIAVHFYSTINTILLGIFFGPVAVAHFAIAEKIFQAIWGMFGPIGQALFPVLAQMRALDFQSFARAARRALAVYSTLLILAAVALYVLSGPLVWLVAGEQDLLAQRVLKVFAIALCFTGGSFMSLLLIAQDQTATLAKITFATMLVNLAIIWPLLSYFEVVGAALAFVIVQVFHTILQVWAISPLLQLRNDSQVAGQKS